LTRGSRAAGREGVLFAASCAVLTAAAFLLGKQVLGELSALQLVTSVYSCSALFFLGHLLLSGERRTSRLTLGPGGIGSSAWIGAFDLVYNVALFSALRSMTSAAHGFCSLLGEVVTIALGVLVLGERYRSTEALWMLVAAAGVVVIQWSPVTAGRAGLAWILVASLASGARTVLAKRTLDSRSPAEVAFVRTAIVALGLLGISAASGTLTAPSARTAGLVAAMGLVGPFLNTLCFYQALRRLSVARVVILRMIYVVLIPLGAVLSGGQALSPREVIGGAAILAGCAMLVRGRGRRAAGAAAASPPPATT